MPSAHEVAVVTKSKQAWTAIVSHAEAASGAKQSLLAVWRVHWLLGHAALAIRAETGVAIAKVVLRESVGVVLRMSGTT